MQIFENRKQAGQLLAEKLVAALSKEKIDNAIALGLPRGGVPVAVEIAAALNIPLGLLVAKKIGAPGQPELAVGAVSVSGIAVVDERMDKYFENLSQYIEKEKERLVKETITLEKHWLEAAQMKRPELTNKNVIIVDDGVATGMTTLVALQTAKDMQAASVILATPVIPIDTYNKLVWECDLLVSLSMPTDFNAVGNYYKDFHQVEDQEVITALKSRKQI